MTLKYVRDVPTLSLFLGPILTVFFSKTGETGDINKVQSTLNKVQLISIKKTPVISSLVTSTGQVLGLATQGELYLRS